ncbi:hypothetical protein ACVMIH_004973 [Bradyrhizobium sp. USDA 4503]
MMRKRWLIGLTAVVVVVAAAWSARSIAIDAYMADDFVVTNSISNAKKACLAENDAEACAYAEAPSYTRLKAMCTNTLDPTVFVRVCPVGMTQGRDIEVDRAFAARKRP